MKPRGEYRPIFESLVDGKDFQRLSPDARLLFFIVKLSLGTAGIRAIPGALGVLAERAGLPEERVAAARDELISGDWLDVERNVWWLKRGLSFEPTVSASNRKHRAFIQRLVAGLPSLDIRSRFQLAYPEWFAPVGDTPTEGDMDRTRNGHPIPITKGHRKGHGKGHPKGHGTAMGSTPHPTPTPPLPPVCVSKQELLRELRDADDPGPVSATPLTQAERERLRSQARPGTP